MTARVIISKGAPLGIGRIAQYLSDGFNSSGAAQSFIRDFQHRAGVVSSSDALA